MRELAHVVKNLSNDYEVKELIDSEIKELENSLKKMEKCYEYFQHGVAPIQKKLDDTLNEIRELKSKFYDCFEFNESDEKNDEPEFKINVEKLNGFKEEAYEWKYC